MYPNPQAFFDRWNGKSVDVDGAYGAQCWDAFARFCKDEGVDCSTYCALTGYAGDLYKLRYSYGYDHYFEFFFPKHAQRGDWIFWDQHVAMVWDVYSDGRVLCFGQNQDGKKWFTLKTYNLNSALGCMRWKGWINTMSGWIKSGGKWYYFRNGEKLTGWHQLNWSKGRGWFLFADDGAMMTGLVEEGTDWYYLDPETGAMRTGEISLELVFNSSGQLIGGKA